MVGPVRGLSRGDALDALGRRRFDLLVVGGGIVGAGIAAHAARMGLAVALVDRGDFGAATSSGSSKLVHGGLRYLRLGDVRLVREAHAERHLLERVVAPHLVRRIPFLFTLYRDGPYNPLVVETGILAYSALARERPGGLVRPERAKRMAPGLRVDGLRRCAVYADAWTNDSRLCLANVTAAAELGAVVLNGAAVTALRLVGGRCAGADVLVEGHHVAVEARTVVNAAGPWVDQVRALESPAAGTSVRLSKGVHVLVALDEPWRAALTAPHDAVRVTFAVPWYGLLLLGTTDDAFDGPPDGVAATPAEIDRALAEAAVAVEPRLLRPEGVRSTFAALRVLPTGGGDSARVKRETVFTRGRGGMLSVAGGKLTTYRRIALDALERLRGDLGLRGLDRSPWPLPGAAGLAEARLPLDLEPALRSHLLHLYGSRAADVLAPAVADPSLLERLHPDGPDIAAQALYAVTHEWARDADDVLLRRTTVGWRGLADGGARARVARLLADRCDLARA